MKTHSWSKPKHNEFTEVQKCTKCGLFRFKALGRWVYSIDEVTNEKPLVDLVENKGCKNENR